MQIPERAFEKTHVPWGWSLKQIFCLISDKLAEDWTIYNATAFLMAVHDYANSDFWLVLLLLNIYNRHINLNCIQAKELGLYCDIIRNYLLNGFKKVNYMSEFRLAVGIENRKRFTKSGDNPSENMSCQDIKEDWIWQVFRSKISVNHCFTVKWIYSIWNIYT